jgi:hypothetical protein
MLIPTPPPTASGLKGQTATSWGESGSLSPVLETGFRDLKKSFLVQALGRSGVKRKKWSFAS